jgi:hypothetical protein
LRLLLEPGIIVWPLASFARSAYAWPLTRLELLIQPELKPGFHDDPKRAGPGGDF